MKINKVTETLGRAVHTLDGAQTCWEKHDERGAFAEMVMARVIISAAEDALVADLRAAGHSWAAIGEVTGYSKAGAQRRWAA